MPTYVIVNRYPHGYQGSPEAMAAWNRWFEGLGAALLDRGNPVFVRDTVGNVAADTALGGYTVLTAGDLSGAIALVEDCPAVREGGGVEVGELAELNRGTRPVSE